MFREAPVDWLSGFSACQADKPQLPELHTVFLGSSLCYVKLLLRSTVALCHPKPQFEWYQTRAEPRGIDGLMQKRCNSRALTIGLRLFASIKSSKLCIKGMEPIRVTSKMWAKKSGAVCPWCCDRMTTLGPVLLTFLRHVARISANDIAAFKESCAPIG